MIKINFKRMLVEANFGEYNEMDLCKPIGNCIRKGTPDIEVDDKAREIYYSEGEVEIPDRMVEHISEIISKSNLLAFVKRAVMDALRPQQPKIKKGGDAR